MSWFYFGFLSINFQSFLRQLYVTSDRLRLIFTKKTRLLMIDGGDECAHSNKGDP